MRFIVYLIWLESSTSKLQYKNTRMCIFILCSSHDLLRGHMITHSCWAQNLIKYEKCIFSFFCLKEVWRVYYCLEIGLWPSLPLKVKWEEGKPNVGMVDKTANLMKISWLCPILQKLNSKFYLKWKELPLSQIVTEIVYIS